MAQCEDVSCFSGNEEEEEVVSCFKMEREGFDKYSNEKFRPHQPSEPSTEDACRGLALILINGKFKVKKDNREGADKDRELLIHFFEREGFDVICFNDLAAYQMTIAVEKAVNLYDHKRATMCVCAILSHGGQRPKPKPKPRAGNCDRALDYDEGTRKKKDYDEGTRKKKDYDVVFGSDHRYVFTSDLIAPFDCQDLSGKPKLFFIQACRGGKADPGVSTIREEGVSTSNAPSETEAGSQDENTPDPELAFHATQEDPWQVSNSNEAMNAAVKYKSTIRDDPDILYNDCLVMYSTPEGFEAWKNSDGSHFVTCLCEVLQRYSFDASIPGSTEGVSLLRILTRVIGRVAELDITLSTKKEKKDGVQADSVKQVPVIVPSLTEDLLMYHRQL